MCIRDSITRADRAFAIHQWEDSIAHYKELLRRFPGHKDIASWERRLREAEEQIR